MAEITLYRSRADVTDDMLTELLTAVPDAYIGEDGNLYILFNISAGQFENGFLANQLVLNDMFVQTASLQALRQRGAEHGLEIKEGVRSTGAVTFGGAGGTYIPIGSEVAYDPGGGLDLVYFQTTTDGTVPNTGPPTPPVAAINATAGNLTGTYEYATTFVTANGETLQSIDSNAITPSAQQANLTVIPLGGPGTVARNIYRQKNGTGQYRLIAHIADNTTTTFTDNMSDATWATAALAPGSDTSVGVTVNAQAIEPGIEGNVGVGTITIISQSPASLTSVTNAAAFTGGAEQEGTEEFRARLSQFLQNPETGSPSDIKTWAEAVAGVDTATVFTNDNLGTATNGHTTIRVSGPGGTAPPTSVTDAVLATVQAKGLANITFHVATFVADVQAVTVDVTTLGTYVLADVTPAVQSAITDYINGLAVGETLYLSGIIAAVKPLAGIADVTVTSPATNQTTTATHKKTPGTITVT